MTNLSGFNALEVEPNVPFEALPANDYVAIIANSDMKPTKAGTGQYLELTFQIVDGEYQGRQLRARLNLSNPSEMAVKIARGDLSAICRAVNIMQPTDSLELHNIPLVITVVQEPREDNGKMTNEITGYASRNPAMLGVPPAATPFVSPNAGIPAAPPAMMHGQPAPAPPAQQPAPPMQQPPAPALAMAPAGAPAGNPPWQQ